MQLKTKLIILTILLILFYTPNISISKYSSQIVQEGIASIAEPIIIIEEIVEPISMLIDKNSFPLEYSFIIKNYDGDKINEVDFYYNIEIQNSTENFPITYKLIENNTGEEIPLENNKTANLQICKSIEEEKNLKLILEWDRKEGELSDEINFIIKVNVIQQKIGEY